jgi:hypothetical protein
MCDGLLPQTEIGVPTGEDFQSWQVHQALCILEFFSLNILLGLRCFVAGNPVLDNFLNCKNERCALPLLFRTLLHFLVGLSERSFGIRNVVTGPAIARRFRGRNWIGRLRDLRLLLIRSTRHHGLSETELKCVNHKLK